MKTRDEGTTSRRWLRRLAIVAAVVIAALAIAVWQIPNLLSTQPGTRFVEGMLNSNPQQTVAIGSLDLAWSGQQRITGFAIRTADGSMDATVDVALSGSLWEWGPGRSRDFGTVSVSGDVTLTDAYFAREAEPVTIPPDLAASLELTGLNVAWKRETGAIALSNLNGSATLLDREATLDFSTDIRSGTDSASSGRLRVQGVVPEAIGTDGKPAAMPPAGTDLRVEADEVSSALLASLGIFDAAQAAALGPTVDASLALTSADAASHALSATVESANLTASFPLAIGDGRMVLAAGQEATVTLALTPEALAALAPPETVTLVAEDGAPVIFTVTNLSLPFDPESPQTDLTGAAISADLIVPPLTLRDPLGQWPEVHTGALAVTLTSDDLTGRIDIGLLSSLASADGTQTPSRIEGSLSLDRALAADGSLNRNGLTVDGALSADAIATPVLDVLAGTEGLLTDLFGEQLTGLSILARQEAGGPGSPATLSITLDDPQAQARLAARLVEGRVEAMITADREPPATLTLPENRAARIRLNRELETAGLPVRLPELGTLSAQVDAFTLPLPAEGEAAGTGASLRGNLRLDRAIAMLPGDAESGAPAVGVNLTDALLEFAADDLRERLDWNLRTDATHAERPFSVSGFGSIADPLSSPEREIRAELELTDVPTVLARRWAGERLATAQEALGESFDVSATAHLQPGGIDIISSLSADSLQAEARMTETVDLRTLRAEAVSTVSPQLLRLLQSPESTIALDRPASLTLSLNAQGDPSLPWTSLPATAEITTPDPLILSGLTATARPATITDFAASAALPQGLAGPVAVEATAALAAAEGPVVRRAALTAEATGSSLASANVTLNDVNVTNLESLLGREAESLRGLLGSAGSLTARLVPMSGRDGQTFAVDADFDRLKADVSGSLLGDVLALNTGSTVETTLTPEWYSTLLAAADQSEASRLQVLNPTPVQIRIEQASLPMAYVRGETVSGSEIVLDARVDLRDLRIQSESAAPFSLPVVAATVSGTSLADGLRLQARAYQEGQTPPSELFADDLRPLGPAPETLWADLTLVGATSDSTTWLLTGDASLVDTPVSLLDGAADTQGVLLDVMGETFSVDFVCLDLNPQTGWFSLSFASPYSQLMIPRAELADNRLLLHAKSWAMVDVTAAMTESVLRAVNPMLYDVQKKSGPVWVEFRSLGLPLDGDISALDADLTLDLGQVEVAKTSLLGELLGTAKDKAGERTTSRIPPITAKINAGRLHYDTFVLQSDFFNITTGGDVDLVNRRLDLNAEVPIVGWTQVFGEMTNLGPLQLSKLNGANVPFYLKVTGPIDKPKIAPDPDGVAKVFKQVFGGTVDSIFRILPFP